MTGVGKRFALGMPLLEVFSVSINKNEDSSDGRYEVYGTIRVIDERGTDATLYDRGPENSECITQNETLTLTGPHRCISALTGFSMYVDLKDKNGGDLEISKGQICWDQNNYVLWDKQLAINIPGRNGFATVHCAVYSAAAQASVEVSLLKKDKTPLDDVGVYGKIVAYYGRKRFDYSTSDQRKYFRSTLFERTLGKAVKLEGGNKKYIIPLSRSFVTVPSSSVLIIEANLYLADSQKSIVEGQTTEFMPECSGDLDINGEGFRAEVEVFWDRLNREEAFK